MIVKFVICEKVNVNIYDKKQDEWFLEGKGDISTTAENNILMEKYRIILIRKRIKIFILTKEWFHGLHVLYLVVANGALKYEMNSA